jgi:isopenicillin N synthase-like dioxygenase
MTPQTMGYLPIIHFYNLASPGPEQKVEIEKLLRVTQDLGFFYLDLRNNSGTESPILELRSRLFEVAKDLFDLPAAEKSRYDVKTNGGYFG